MSGGGETWQHIRSVFPNAELTALDFSEGMLQCAKKKASPENNIRILHHDILCNTLQDNSFDYVVCAFGLKTFDETQIAVIAQETARILKPGGEFSFIEISLPENKLLKLLYEFHLRYVLPFAGKILSGQSAGYNMLWCYVRQFVSAQPSEACFKNVGLVTTFHKYFYGCATGVSGYKKN